MKLIIGNIKTKAVIGGVDNLLPFDIMKKLKDYLKIRVEGYQRTEAYQEGRWDGYKHFITDTGNFSTGFLPLVAKYLEELGVSLTVSDERINKPEYAENLDNFIGVIDGVTWLASPENKRDYQLKQVKAIRDNYIKIGNESIWFPRGILDSATNAGKNSISALFGHNIQNRPPTIFMVSNKTIYKQAVEFFSQAFDMQVGEVRSGYNKPEWFTVCMVKTLLNQAKKDINVRKWLNTVSVLIVDESDESGANQYAKTISYINAYSKIFVSGTPLDSTPDNNMTSIGLSGPVVAKITNQELIDLGHSQKPDVRILLNRPTKYYALDISYLEAVERVIYTSLDRVKIIQGILEKHSDKYVVVSFVKKIHGYFMFNYLRSVLPNIDMNIVHGESPDREDILDSYKSKKISVLFSSMILKRGANVPNIEVLIMAHGGKSKITVKQYSGRGLRHDGVNDSMLIYDIYDEVNHLDMHSRKRIGFYKAEGFDVTFEYSSTKAGKPL